MELHEALYYDKNNDGSVTCSLCPHNCKIQRGNTGLCHARRNIDGKLFADSYGKVTALALDGVETKSIYLYRPGCDILSVGSYGCSFKCSYCENSSISQEAARFKYISPEKLVGLAKENRTEGNIGIAYTYNEPFISYEYVYDCAKLAKTVELENVLVTNGFINERPLKELLPYIDAMNIDLKSFSDSFYYNICGGDIEPVKKTIAISAEVCHIEITTLVIPGYNDKDEEIESIAKFIADISDEIPLHLSRHHPSYHMFKPDPINEQQLKHLADVASQHLEHVFCENL